jgi:hypothetical protein
MAKNVQKNAPTTIEKKARPQFVQATSTAKKLKKEWRRMVSNGETRSLRAYARTTDYGEAWFKNKAS